MSFIRRNWTPGEADDWTKEDWIAVVLSVASYILLMVGTVLAFLLNIWGFIILALGILTTYFMHWVIDPKLKTVSEEYEKKQHEYLENLERKVRWEEIHG